MARQSASAGRPRRIFEAGDVEHERKLAIPVIPADRRKVTAASLPKRTTIIGGDHNTLPARRGRECGSPIIQACTLSAMGTHIRPIATRETGELVHIQPALAHLIQCGAAIQ
jgi:hypothetical protein